MGRGGICKLLWNGVDQRKSKKGEIEISRVADVSVGMRGMEGGEGGQKEREMDDRGTTRGTSPFSAHPRSVP